MPNDDDSDEQTSSGEVVDIRDRDDEIDQKVLQARLGGEAIGQIGRRLKLSDRAVLRSLARSLPELTPELRQRLYQEDLVRCDQLLGVWFAKARGGDAAATSLCIKIMERRSAMVGSDSSTRIELRAWRFEGGAEQHGQAPIRVESHRGRAQAIGWAVA
jgi:hypothetical protein